MTPLMVKGDVAYRTIEQRGFDFAGRERPRSTLDEHDLSDVTLADALDDRASFRRFCGFSDTEATPERTAFVRFRRLLVVHHLDRALTAHCSMPSRLSSPRRRSR